MDWGAGQGCGERKVMLKIHKIERQLMWRIHENCGKIILGFCLYFDEWECYFK